MSGAGAILLLLVGVWLISMTFYGGLAGRLASNIAKGA